ncbi:MAG: restriction endonuclease subunit S [Acinetobacter sp.]
MTQYQQYAEYQDSGVEWLGEIPSHWVIQKLKWEITAKSGTDAKSEDGEFDLYGANGLIGKSSTFIDLSKLPVVLVGRVGSAGSLNYLTQCAGISDNALIIENNKYKTSRFEFYLLSSLKLEELVSKNAQPLITASNIRDIIVPISLDINERTQIANFLDHETAKIDGLIEKQQQLIQLLKEKRQAVISHAVTKGLNPNVPMKDSGVEWLGQVPEHWVKIKLKFIVKSIIDAEHKTAPYFEDGEYLVCRTTNVRNGQLKLDGGKYTNQDTYNEWTQRAIPEIGDILFTREAPAGEACVYDGSVPLCLGQRMVLFKLDQSKVCPDFVLYSIYSGLADDFIKQLSQGSTVTHFNMSDIQNIPLFEPPQNEQIKIKEYLMAITGRYDELISKAESAIQLMQERRTALISAAVTGKIDVRNWQNPNNNNEAKMEFSA